MKTVNESEFDEFYGRDRDIEIGFLSKLVIEVTETLPEKEKTALENYACHLDNACSDIAIQLFNTLLLMPKKKHNEIIKMTLDKVAEYLESNDDNEPKHPDFDWGTDFDEIDVKLRFLADEMLRIKQGF